MNNLYVELTVLMMLAGAVAVFLKLLKQPTLIAYITSGLIVGPFGYFKINQGDSFAGLAEVGITLLLFMIGLELDLTQIKHIGKAAFVAGFSKIAIVGSVCFAVVKLFGLGTTPALYIGLAMSFASTIIAVKLLSEKRDLHSLYGKISVGVLILEDFVAIAVLLILTSMPGAQGALSHASTTLPPLLAILATPVKALVLGLIIWVNSRYIFPPILRFIGKSDELVLIFSLAWALGFALLCSTSIIGFNLQIGGFLAGLALAKSAVHYEVAARVKPLRDFFLIIFFIVLGSELIFDNIASVILQALVLSGIVLLLNPLISLVTLGLLGYKPRTAFLTGASLSQISEFSLILMATGLSLGHLTNEHVTLATLVGIFTFAVSSYIIQYNENIYDYLKPFLKIFDFAHGRAEVNGQILNLKNHIVLAGAHRMGSYLIRGLEGRHQKVVVVDFNPEIVEKFTKAGILSFCGDMTDSYIQELVNLDRAKMLISTIPSQKENISILHTLSKINPKCISIIIASSEEDAVELYEKGANYALLPHFIGEAHLHHLFSSGSIDQKLLGLKERHLKHLGSVMRS